MSKTAFKTENLTLKQIMVSSFTRKFPANQLYKGGQQLFY